MMRYYFRLIPIVLLLLSACAPVPTAMPAAPTIPTWTNTPTPTETLTPSPTSTTRPANTATATPRPTFTPTPAPTLTPTPLPDLFRPVTPIDDVLPGDFERLHAAPDGALWLMSDQGVAWLVDDAWSIYLTGFAGELVGIDAERIWVVSEDASEISAWDGVSWTDYAADAGWLPIPLHDEGYRDMGWGQSDGAARFWLATSQDVRVFDGERWTVFTPEDMGMGEVGDEAQWATFALKVSQSTGDVWVGECDWCSPGPFGGQGARWFDGQVWHGADSPVASGCTTVIEEDSLGRIWLGVDEILWRYDPASGNWTQFTPPEPPIAWTRFGFAYAIVLDQSDDPWPAMVLCGASCYGKVVLYHIHDGVWTQIGEAQEFYGVLPPHQLVTGAAGQLWLFWEGGIYRIAGNVAEPETNLYVQSVAVDATGQVWFVARDEGRDTLWAFDTGTEN